ncbi:transglycosylase SLT domain-containing protein [Campylobacter sp. faydin G-24]|uniref:Transglycosylase SLT domain-containing protein n=1 Tax=Campylobacter anatolicus TaxID=2829105 RepID=A0ABS5HFH8_9BACT|nr:lytic transglycosylase domain-containing protein [Campylobacter anatolicus]MBR8462548.1 transglycosylase SLT domain-containing protein [Campylobacter anatolicus]MBR8463019.1 transglycosylase SLT domain-containing protein [Campylobacter anatolicus]
MKAILKIFLLFVCSLTLFANTSEHSSYNTQAKILKELDIDPSFMKTKSYIDAKYRMQNTHIRNFANALKNGYMYIPMIKTHIKTSGIPESFFYLAMIESGFETHTTSKAKAVGIWQFMERTARLHGLKVNEYVDERKDPIASTKAAATYLRSMKDKFGKWYLAVMAYNCGEGALSRAIQKAGTNDIAVLLDEDKKYLPKETRRFVVKILRAAYIAKDAERLLSSSDSSLLNATGGLKLAKVQIPGGTHLAQVGDSIGLSVKKMKDNNPHLKFVFTPPNLKDYYIYIPENKKQLFATNFKPSYNKNHFYTYIVKKGDTLLHISKKTGISHRAIREYNELKTNAIAYNQKLIIPVTQSNKSQKYIVQNGDTLVSISKKFNVKVDDIKEANAMASSDLNIGANIVIP